METEEDLLAGNKTVFDHSEFLMKHPKLIIKSIIVYESNYVEAVATKFIDKFTGIWKVTMAHGSNISRDKDNQHTINLGKGETIDSITTLYNQKYSVINSLIFSLLNKNTE